MPISSQTIHAPVVTHAHRRCGDSFKNQVRAFRVESKLFLLNTALVCKVSATFRKIVLENVDPNLPIVLRGHTAQQFDNLLSTLHSNSLPCPLNDKDLERLLDVEELSRHYSINQLQMRAESSLLALITMANTPAILSCSSQSLFRMLRLVSRVRSDHLFAFLIKMCIWRLHSRELHYVHAMRLAQPSRWNCDAQPFLKLLGHAFYAAMIDLEPNLSKGQGIGVDSPLTRAEITHVLCGYHSLRCWWDKIASKPPSYAHSPRCMYPEKCCHTWQLRYDWVAGTNRIPSPQVDAIRRLQEMHKYLTNDLSLNEDMPEACRHNALAELQKRTDELLKTVHHHFDL